MREIKFRQPRFHNDKFIDWFYWGFLDDDSGIHFVSPLRHDVDNYQFTGLKDRNGTEIYEGDITNDTCKVCIGCFNTGDDYGTLAFGVYKTDGISSWGLVPDYPETIIGNIHQNPIKGLMEKA